MIIFSAMVFSRIFKAIASVPGIHVIARQTKIFAATFFILLASRLLGKSFGFYLWLDRNVVHKVNNLIKIDYVQEITGNVNGLLEILLDIWLVLYLFNGRHAGCETQEAYDSLPQDEIVPADQAARLKPD